MEHIPVLLEEVKAAFASINIDKTNVSLLDGTFGRGGHSSCLLKEDDRLKVFATDQDQAAIEFGKVNFPELIEKEKLSLYHCSYHEISRAIESDKWPESYDYILLDLGVSSPQLDEAHRGFSFYHDGPLDMRMNQETELTAAEILNEWDEDELVEIFKTLGEVRRPYRVVRAVVHDRKTEPFTSTEQLAGLIARVDGWRKKGKHPATQYFMALRLVVNRELDILKEFLPELVKKHLSPGGRIAVLSFHSLEDRIIKNIFKSLGEYGVRVNKKVIIATKEEQKNNSRSRSAKLRVFERSAHASS